MLQPLLAGALSAVELRDWCALEGASCWARAAVHRDHPVLRSAVLSSSIYKDTTLWELCEIRELTQVWARLADDRETKDDSRRILQNGRGNTPLHVVLESTKWCLNDSVANEAAKRLGMWFLSRPSAAAYVGSRNLRGQTVLHLCARYNHVAVAQCILGCESSGALDARDDFDTTPLVEAVREEHPAMVATLLAARADANAFVPNCHGHGDTPLILAVRLKNIGILQQLLEAPDIDLDKSSMDEQSCPIGKTALDFAPENGLFWTKLQAASQKCALKKTLSLESNIKIFGDLKETHVGNEARVQTCQDHIAEGEIARDSQVCSAWCGPTLTSLRVIICGMWQP